MKFRIGKKGFTLVEVLAVLVILAAIMGIALPSITSSMERNKEKQNESKYKLLESFAEVYVSDNKNAIYTKLGINNECYISVAELRSGGYLSDDADVDADGNPINGKIKFNRVNNTYEYNSVVDNTIIDCK